MFEISRKDNGDVELKGRLDASQEGKAREVLDHLSESGTIDFRELQYISSAGLGVLLAAQKRLMGTGHRLRIANMNTHIREIFEMAGFHQIFDLD